MRRFVPNEVTCYAARFCSVTYLLKSRTEDIESRVDITLHIAKKIHAIQETCTAPRIQAPFRAGGSGVNASIDPARMEFNQVQLPNGKGFEGTWRIDYPLENPNRRGQATLYDLINERFAEVFPVKSSNPNTGSSKVTRILITKGKCKFEPSGS
jgi:hypothetical protein